MTGTRQHTVDEDEFQAFVDGHLSPERRRAVMAYLAANAGEAARMSADQRGRRSGFGMKRNAL